MKAEINNENKAKFFALYWGQEVLCPLLIIHSQVIDMAIRENYFLYLKPLSSISGEDALLCGYDTREQAVRLLAWNTSSLPTYETDYLRSKGYVLPWMGLSVDEIVEAGWVKLV